MPIVPKIDWRETDDSLEVNVHVAAGGKADVFATDCLLKVNAPPYLLIADLYGFVDESHTVASISSGCITFRLTKAAKCRGTWGQLEVSPPVTEEDKAEIAKRRNESVDRAHARIEAERKARLERVKQEEKEATDRQIEMERKRRQEIEERKKQELQEEKRKLNDWQMDLKKPMSSNKDEDDSDYEDEEEVKNDQPAVKEEEPMPDHPDYHGKGWRREAKKQPGRTKEVMIKEGVKENNVFVVRDKSLLYESDDEDHEPDQGKEVKPEAKQGEVVPSSFWPAPSTTAAVFKPLPPPRIRLEPVPVQFTKLETSHLPARAQREEEIKVYKKNAKEGQARPEDSVDVSDRQPVFLKDKGDALYKQGNFRGAINAYKRAVELDPDSLPAAWSNMAACHLQLGENEACVHSCSQCIQRLEARVESQADALERGEASEEVVGFRKMLVKALIRRGQALTNLEQIPLAIKDYSKALSYDPANEAIKSDIEELNLAASTDSMDEQAFVEALRERAGARFAAKDYQGAAEAFSRIITLLMHQAGRGTTPAPEKDKSGDAVDPHVTALSNRAACYLALERYEDVLSDCTSALGAMLQSVQEGQALLESAQAWAKPQLNLASRLLARRGAAYAHMKQWEESIADYSSAADLARMLVEVGEGAGAVESLKRVAQLEADRDRVQAMLAQ